MTYTRAPSTEIARPLTEIGPVLAWENRAVVFLCPCGGREVYVTSPPHTISFPDNQLHLDGSVGSRPIAGEKDFRLVHGEALHNLPANWCHFFVKDGVYEMCGDAQCPGRNL